MNKEILMVMQRLYAGSGDPALILDEDWKTVWSSDGTTVDALPERMGISRGSWENAIRPLLLGETLYTCRLQCSAQDGLRTVQLTPSAQPMDLQQLGSQLQSMLTVCTALDADLDGLGIYEERDRLNALAGHILHVYRAVFLRNEIERGIKGMWQDETFCLQTALTDTFGKLPNLLRDTAVVAIRPGEGKQFLRGDVSGFKCALLAAMLLCIHEPEHMQQIEALADAQKDQTILEIRVKPLGEKRRDAGEQDLTAPCGTAADRELLELYCRTFGIGLFFAESQGFTSCRLELPTSAEMNSIQLGAPRQAGADGFFDLVPVMMAAFRTRKRF